MAGEDRQTCIQEGRLQRIEERMKQHDDANQKTHRLFYERFEEEGKCRVRLEEKFNAVMTALVDLKAVSLKEIKEDLEELKEKPAKRWESVITSIISVCVGMFITYVVMKGGV